MLRTTPLLATLAIALTAAACAAPTKSVERRTRGTSSAEEESTSESDVSVAVDAEEDAELGRGRIEPSEHYPLGDPEVGRGVVDGHQLVEGDLIAPEVTPSGVARLNTYEGLAPKWPGGVIAFTIDAAFPKPERVWQAIKHWEANTPVRFVQRTTEVDYVKFFVGEGCYARLGMIGGEQPLSLAAGCTTGNSVHEIGHVLGILHEQSRSDRDQFIKVIDANIDPTFLPQFRRLDKPAIGTYDVDSIMQYNSKAFSANGQNVMTKLDGSLIEGQRRGLSPNDIAGVNELYKAEFAKVVNARVDVRWAAKSPTAEYSLDVVLTDGTKIAPCVGTGTLGKLTGHAFTGRCITANRTVALADVKEFAVCTAGTCASAPFGGDAKAGVAIKN